MQGTDLVSLLTGEKEEIREFTYSETYLPANFENQRIAYRDKKWKLIREPYQKTK